MAKIRQSDIARELGVSRSLVSQALRGKFSSTKAEEIRRRYEENHSDAVAIVKSDFFRFMVETFMQQGKAKVREIKDFDVLVKFREINIKLNKKF